MMLSFVIHSKPVLACYSSPDRFPLLNWLLLGLRRKKLTHDPDAIFESCANISVILFLFRRKHTSYRTKHRFKKDGGKKIHLKSKNMPGIAAVMLFFFFFLQEVLAVQLG